MLAPHRFALAAILGLSAVLNVYDLSRNGWANNFYSAGVKSMLLSLHNFLFISFDPGGLITLDKPPLAIWLQAVSAKIFGFTPMALLLPEAIAGVLCVGALYLAMARPFGRPAALMGALCLAVFPAFVAVNRDNNPDALLILLMTLSCWVALRAIQSGRLRSIVLCGILVALAFNTKTLAAYLVVPGIALGYLICAPGPLASRVWKLLIAGAVMAVISIAWLSFVDVTPASRRPYVGSSLDNSELGLTFAYNGLGRIGGQTGGPVLIPVGSGANAPLPTKLAFEEAGANHQETEELALHAFGPLGHAISTSPSASRPCARSSRRRASRSRKPPLSTCHTAGRANRRRSAKRPCRCACSKRRSAARPAGCCRSRCGGAFALLALLAGSWRRPARSNGSAPLGRRDPKLAGLLVLGGWFAVEAVVLSLAGDRPPLLHLGARPRRLGDGRRGWSPSRRCCAATPDGRGCSR